MPVAINLFASRKRMLSALEISSYEDWDARLDFFLDPKPPEGILDKLKALPRVTELASVFPKTVRSAPCQEVVEAGEGVGGAHLPASLRPGTDSGGPAVRPVGPAHAVT